MGFGLIPLLCLFALQTYHNRSLTTVMEQVLREQIGTPAPHTLARDDIERRKDVVAAEVHAQAGRQTAIHVAALALLALLVTLGSTYASRQVTQTLRMLVKALGRLAAGDFTVRLPGNTRDERDRLLDAFNDTIPKLEDQVHTRQALQIAKEIHRNFMPPVPLTIPGLDIAFSNISCDETGGDYVDIIFPDGRQARRVILAIGDVSGHGIGPALLMADVRGMLRALASQRAELQDTVVRLNRLLLEDVGDSGHFMTLLLADLDVARGVLHRVRAGHDPGYLFDSESESFRELGGKGCALGLFDEARFQSQSTEFDQPGQMLLLATDGIWEARDPDNRLFGKNRLMDVVRRAANRSAEEILVAIVDAVKTFRRSARQSDDITLMVIKRI